LLNLYLVPRYGFVAAAVMTVLTEAVLVSQYVWTLRGLLSRLRWDHTVVRPVIAALVMGIVISVARDLPLIAICMLAGASYAILVVLLGVVGKDEIRFVRGMRRPGLVAQPSFAQNVEAP
jgi:O-antigen/teichoic acid export membrane protein